MRCDARLLRSGLRAQSGSFDSNLIDAVHSSFPNVVQIRQMLRSTKEHLLRVCVEIENHHRDASMFACDIENRLRKLDVAITKRDALLDLCEQVRNLRQMAQALNCVETLLEPPADEPAVELAFRLKRLRRASSECGRLMLLRGNMIELVAVRSHAVRMDSARSKLISQLCDCMNSAMLGGATRTDALSVDNSTSGVNDLAVSHLFSGFVEAEAEEEAATWLRTAWIAPQLIPRLAAAAKAHDATLATLADTLLAFLASESFAPRVGADAASVVATAGNTGVDSDRAGPIYLICEGAWVEWCRHVGENHAHLFGAGIPRTFHAAYLALHRTLAVLEASLPTSAMRRRLRNHPSTAAVLRRFNLAIYFQLRRQHIMGPLESALGSSSSTLQPAAKSGADATDIPPPPGSWPQAPLAPPLLTAPAYAMVVAIRAIVSPAVFLRPLASRFLRLILQCATKFASWVECRLPSDVDVATAGAADSDAKGAVSLPVDLASKDRAAVTHPTGALGEPSSASSFYLDMLSVVRWLRDCLRPSLAALLLLPADDAATNELAAECSLVFDEAIDAIGASAAQLRTSLVENQVAASNAALAPIRAIVASYRMTGKSSPTAASFFISGVLKPLRTFLDAMVQREAGCYLLDAQARQEWALEVATHVTLRYLEAAASTLEMVRRDEDARQRLTIKRGNLVGEATGGGADGTVVSDAHKICLQFCLDVQGRESIQARDIEPTAHCVALFRLPPPCPLAGTATLPPYP